MYPLSSYTHVNVHHPHRRHIIISISTAIGASLIPFMLLILISILKLRKENRVPVQYAHISCYINVLLV